MEHALGRREANKQRTRQAILDAARELVMTQQTTALTADHIADAAGVSRRTFFNYFAGIDELLAEISLAAIDRFGAAIVSSLEQQPLVDSAAAVLADVLTTELLADLVPMWQVVEESPVVLGRMLRAQQDLTDQLGDEIVSRVPHCSGDAAMLIAVTAACVFAAFETARRHWLADVELPVDDADRDRLLDLTTQAFTLAREGLAQA